MIDADVTIKGLQEAQDANNRAITALKPANAFGRAIQLATTMAHRGVVSRAHVDTGAMRASQRQSVRGLEGRVYTDPTARNPRSGARPALYAVVEEERGGSHAFYGRTFREEGQRIADAALGEIRKSLP